MASVLKAMQSKSDQLNYVDVGNGSLIALIERVDVTNSDQQSVIVHFKGCNGKPYKPNTGMIRVLAGAWGEDGDSWVGKTIKIVGDEKVKWGGKEVGGLVIGALSHINQAGYTAFIQKNRSVRVKQTIPLLVIEVKYFSDELFKRDSVNMIEAIKGGSATIEDITKQVNLSPAQVEELNKLLAVK